MNKLPKQWEIKNGSIYIEKYEMLVLGDIHFGKQFNKEKDIKNNLKLKIKKLIEEFQPEKLILNGDTFHNGIYTEEEIKILTELKSHVNKLILLNGNHEDKSNEFNKLNNKFTLKKEYIIGDILIHHGHRTPTQRVNHHIINHLHPCKNKNRGYLHCEDAYYGSSVTILPSFNHLIGCLDYTNYNVNIPILSDGKAIKEYEFIYL